MNDFSTDNMIVKCTEYSINSVADELLKLPKPSEWAKEYYPGFDAYFGCQEKPNFNTHYAFLCELRDKFPDEWEEIKARERP